MEYLIAGVAGGLVSLVVLIGWLCWIGSGETSPPDYGDRN
jgi:hypothetical protein